MGRFLTCGVVTKIELIEKNDVEYKILENKDKVIEQLNKYIDTSNYDVVEYPNALGFELKLDVFNQNINSLFDELDTLVDCKKFWLYNHKEETISLELNRYDDDYDYESDWQKEHNYGKFYVKTEKHEYGDDQTYPPGNYWILYDEYELRKNLKVYIHVLPLWYDFYKVSIESEFYLLHILNTLKTKYFQTILSKSLIIYISG
ncbi:MAG: hypothetical protein IJ501_05240 [Bacilli bacterium]|nr:hypothetical protein [Bacilli bacterium]